MTQNTAPGNTSLHNSLPSLLRDYIEERVASGVCSNPSDHVRALIRKDRRRKVRDRLDALPLEGLTSGEAVPLDDEAWAAMRREVEEKLAANTRAVGRLRSSGGRGLAGTSSTAHSSRR